MSSLYQSYLKAFDLALKRDMRSDTFVIKKTINYIDKAINSMAENDIEILKALHQKIVDYLDSEQLIETRMDMIFGETDYLKKSIFDVNMEKILHLKDKIDMLLA